MCDLDEKWPNNFLNKSIHIIGVPYHFGQPKKGVEHGPQRMREAGLVRLLESMNSNVVDKGDLRFDEFENDPNSENVKNPLSVGSANKKIADAVSDSVHRGALTIVLGGDHSLALGSLSGHVDSSKCVGVIWVDAHADINPPLASPSGNAHGMPLSFLAHQLRQYIPKGIPGFQWIKPCIDLTNLVYIGLRDLDDAEKWILKEFNVLSYTMHDVQRLGINEVTRLAIQRASPPGSNRPIHLSFDIDALDPCEAPSTGTPVPGGLLLREGVYIAAEVAATGRLEVLDMVEVNPLLGSAEDQHRTLQSANEVISACFGRRHRLLIPPAYDIPMPVPI